MSINRITIATIGFVMLWGMCVSSVIGQQGPERTIKQNPAVIQYNGDMANLLSHLPNVYERTIGLEVDPRQPRSTVGFYLEKPSLADVLNAITKSAPIYRWSEKGEFIEVAPVAGSSPLLETPIRSFRVDYADETEAIVQLMNLPEVQAGMNAMRLRYRDPLSAPPDSTTGAGKKMSFTLQNVTLRQVLNKIANENGSRFWVMQRNGAGLFSIVIGSKG